MIVPMNQVAGELLLFLHSTFGLERKEGQDIGKEWPGKVQR